MDVPDGRVAKCSSYGDDQRRSLHVAVVATHAFHIGLTCSAGCDPDRLYAALGLPPPQLRVM